MPCSWSLYADSHLTSNQVSVRLIPTVLQNSWFWLHFSINDASSVSSLSFSFMAHTWLIIQPFPFALSTITFDYSTQRRFETHTWMSISRGLLSSLIKHEFRFSSFLLSLPESFRTHLSAYYKSITGWRIQILQWVWMIGNWRNWLETDKSWKPEPPAKTFPARFLQIFQPLQKTKKDDPSPEEPESSLFSVSKLSSSIS